MNDKVNFETEINYLENLEFSDDFIVKKGHVPVLIIAPHTMEQKRPDNSIKPKETYTKAIALYLNKHLDTSYFIKIKDTGMDANHDNRDEFKRELLRFVRDNDIKLVIDLHGAKKERDFDVEFGTLNNLSADFSTIRELEEEFINHGIYNIAHNDPFKGGAITEYLYSIKDIDVIQLEINGKYRDEYNLDNLEAICKVLLAFTLKYIKYLNN